MFGSLGDGISVSALLFARKEIHWAIHADCPMKRGKTIQSFTIIASGVTPGCGRGIGLRLRGDRSRRVGVPGPTRTGIYGLECACSIQLSYGDNL